MSLADISALRFVLSRGWGAFQTDARRSGDSRLSGLASAPAADSVAGEKRVPWGGSLVKLSQVLHAALSHGAAYQGLCDCVEEAVETGSWVMT